MSALEKVVEANCLAAHIVNSAKCVIDFGLREKLVEIMSLTHLAAKEMELLAKMPKPLVVDWDAARASCVEF